jgi:hypothetical protein
MPAEKDSAAGIESFSSGEALTLHGGDMATVTLIGEVRGA